MKRILLLIVAVMISSLAIAQVLTCRQIQETTDPSGDSPYINQAVTVSGIVVAEKFYTGTNTTNYGFVISDPEGGPWSGLLVFTNRYFPALGDLVEVAGTMSEYYNFSELTSLTNYTVISSGNSLPQPSLVTTGDLANPDTAEQWESCFVKVEDVNITAAPNNYLEFYINDGTGAAQVDDQCFPRSGFAWPASVAVGQNWARIQGVVDYSFNYFAINPRSLGDMLQVDSVANAQIRVQSITAEIDESKTIPLTTSRLKFAWGISSFETVIKIDPAKLEFEGLDITGTLLNQVLPEYTISDDGTQISIVYVGQDPLVTNEDEVALFNLLFKPISYGETMIQVLSFKYDTTPLNSNSLYPGKVSVPIRERMAWLNIANSTDGRNIFDPTMNEKLSISYGSRLGTAGVNARAIVRIYDGKGRLVATPVNTVISSALGIETFMFDGRDSIMRYLSPGFYYCNLEIVERETGRKDTAIQPIVIRANLR
jgi:hypothetical protein